MTAVKTFPSELATMKERKPNFKLWLCSTGDRTKMYKSICKTFKETKHKKCTL